MCSRGASGAHPHLSLTSDAPLERSALVVADNHARLYSTICAALHEALFPSPVATVQVCDLKKRRGKAADSIEWGIRGSNSFREGAQLRAIGCGASDSFCHIWTRSRPGRPADAHHVHAAEAAPCLCPPQSTRTDAIPTRVRAMENPHAERQNVLIQRIIKNAVRSSLLSMQPFLISRFCRTNARKPFLSSTVVSRYIFCR